MGGDDGDRLARLEAKLDAILGERRGPQTAAAPGPAITLGRLFEHFEKARSGLRSWMKNNRNRLVPLIRRHGDLPAFQLTPLVWAEHAAQRSTETHRYGRPPKAHTLATELMRAKEMLRFGVDTGLLDSNPLERMKREKTTSMRETWLDEAGIQQLLGGIESLDGELSRLLMRALILLCVDGMLRLNEARTLRRDRIRDGVIELSARSTKSKRSRFVGLTPRVLQAIAAVPPNFGDSRIFLNPKTKDLFSSSTITLWFAQIRSASGVDALAVDGERVVIHSLRHSGASAADARGASAMAIKDGLGHASLATTQRYLHRHREAGARDLAKIMADGAERERRGPKTAPRDGESTSDGAGRTSNR